MAKKSDMQLVRDLMRPPETEMTSDQLQARTDAEREVRTNGARSRENGPPKFPPLDFMGPLNVAEIPPLKFAYRRFYAPGYISLTVAPPKVGKSLLGIAEAVDMASGGRLLGGPEFDPLPVLYFNAEDDIDVLKARVAATCEVGGIDPDTICEKLSLESGHDWPDFYLVGQNQRNVQIYEPAFSHLLDRFKANRFAVGVFDPLQDLSRADETNETFRALGLRMRRFARESGAAVGIVHHTRKLQNGITPTMDDARGGSALRGISRFNRILVGMDADEAVSANVDDHRRYFRIGEIESNLAPPDPTANQWFEKQSVKIANGEFVGAAMPWDWPDDFAGITIDMTIQVFDSAQSLDPEYRRASAQSEGWFGHAVARICNVDLEPDAEKRKKANYKKIAKLLKTWCASGVLKKGEFKDKSARRNVPIYDAGPNHPMGSN